MLIGLRLLVTTRQSGANAESAKPSARGSWFGAIGAALWGSASSGASPARNASKRASMPSTSSSSSAQQPSSQAAAAADGGGADTGLNGVAKRHSAPESTLRGTPKPLAAANAALDALASGMGGSSSSSNSSSGNSSSSGKSKSSSHSSSSTTTATASAKSSSTSSTRSKSGMASKGSRSEGLDDEERALRKSEHVTLGDFNRIKVGRLFAKTKIQKQVLAALLTMLWISISYAFLLLLFPVHFVVYRCIQSFVFSRCHCCLYHRGCFFATRCWGKARLGRWCWWSAREARRQEPGMQ